MFRRPSWTCTHSHLRAAHDARRFWRHSKSRGFADVWRGVDAFHGDVSCVVTTARGELPRPRGFHFNRSLHPLSRHPSTRHSQRAAHALEWLRLSGYRALLYLASSSEGDAVSVLWLRRVRASDARDTRLPKVTRRARRDLSTLSTRGRYLFEISF